jgi:hypothetical protein
VEAQEVLQYHLPIAVMAVVLVRVGQLAIKQIMVDLVL